MKINYFLVLLFFSLVVSGQENKDNNHTQQNSSGFTLYPNPALDNVVYIRTPSNGVKHITVYDVFGKVVLLDRLQGEALNIVSLSPGVYLIQVVEKNSKMTRKLIVK